MALVGGCVPVCLVRTVKVFESVLCVNDRASAERMAAMG